MEADVVSFIFFKRRITSNLTAHSFSLIIPFSLLSYLESVTIDWWIRHSSWGGLVRHEQFYRGFP